VAGWVVFQIEIRDVVVPSFTLVTVFFWPGVVSRCRPINQGPSTRTWVARGRLLCLAASAQMVPSQLNDAGFHYRAHLTRARNGQAEPSRQTGQPQRPPAPPDQAGRNLLRTVVGDRRAIGRCEAVAPRGDRDGLVHNAMDGVGPESTSVRKALKWEAHGTSTPDMDDLTHQPEDTGWRTSPGLCV
jgi:hypothetical protein